MGISGTVGVYLTYTVITSIKFHTSTSRPLGPSLVVVRARLSHVQLQDFMAVLVGGLCGVVCGGMLYVPLY